MLDRNNLFELARVTANANRTSPVAYSFGDEKLSYSALNETLRAELNEIASTPALYRQNKNILFELMETIIDEVLPKKVIEAYGQFAEVKQFAQGDKPVFVQKVTAASRKRAKQFITKVGLAGVYEVFKLDGKNIEVDTTAYGGAAQIGIEEFLDGRIDFNEIVDIVMEGIDESVYTEIANALEAIGENVAGATYKEASGFIEATMDELVAIADAYGHSAIYCTYELAAKIIPEAQWAADSHKAEKWNNGYISNYKGHTVIVLPQSFTDETNTEKVVDPSRAYIIPGGGSKPVKIAFEGQTIVDEFKNEDWSRELRAYKKLGVATIITNHICIYKDTSLAK